MANLTRLVVFSKMVHDSTLVSKCSPRPWPRPWRMFKTKVQELMQKDLDVWIDGQNRLRSRTVDATSRLLAACRSGNF